VEDTGRNSVTPSTIPRIIARNASDIIALSVLIDPAQKRVLLAYSSLCGNRKKHQNTGCLAPALR
jgi:hypothetical protein